MSMESPSSSPESEKKEISRKKFLGTMGKLLAGAVFLGATGKTGEIFASPAEGDAEADSAPKEKSIEENISEIRDILDGTSYEKALGNPFLVSALYYSESFLGEISNPEAQTDGPKKIIGTIAPLISKEWRSGYMEKLEELVRQGSPEQEITDEEVSPLDVIDWGTGENHSDAIDLFIDEGSSVFAMAGGIVVLAESSWDPHDDLSTSSAKGGNSVIMYNPDRKEFYRYAHLENTALEPGTVLSAGTEIGTVGHTGFEASQHGHGQHLHLEINAYDPEEKRNAFISAANLKERLVPLIRSDEQSLESGSM